MFRRHLIILFTSLWITSNAWGWGALGHRLVAEYGTGVADPAALANCRVTVPQIVKHTTDPDEIWRQQRLKHPHEATAHFFHVDRQPPDWRTRREAKDRKQGTLVFRISEWIETAKRQRKEQKWDALAETLYGLSHYIGDLSQPLHLHHDYDGDGAGLPGLHSQFETKMLNRFEQETRDALKKRLAREKIPSLWSGLELRGLIFDTAAQSHAKATRLFDGARPALHMPKTSRRKKTKRPPSPRFVKKVLWQGTGELAADQLAHGARLWAHVLNAVCK